VSCPLRVISGQTIASVVRYCLKATVALLNSLPPDQAAPIWREAQAQAEKFLSTAAIFDLCSTRLKLWGAVMERAVARFNVERFRRLLAQELDETKRKTVLQLLAEEEAKLASLEGGSPKEDQTA
jgi:hypothetical protein